MTTPSHDRDDIAARRFDAPGHGPDDVNVNQGPSHDELDALLRQWHAANAQRAAAGRDRLVAALRAESSATPHAANGDHRSSSRGITSLWTSGRVEVWTFARVARRYVPAAASLALMAVLAVLMLPQTQRPAMASSTIVYAPDGGRLDAFDGQGNVLGPCALKHTAVDADVSGRFTRVTVTQQYHNPFQKKIEAVYTFPLSHRAAVDRMIMTVTDPSGAERVIVGEVKEREAARQIYESARASGYVASLLEQERPNIFTQSVANIEPGANVAIEISYVEILESTDGTFTFDFPMVVGPRYIPGYATNPMERAKLPELLAPRDGLILLGPAEFTQVDTQILVQQPQQPGDQPEMNVEIDHQTMASLLPRLGAVLAHATAIEPPPPAFRDDAEVQKLLQSRPGIEFWTAYADGSKEFGQLAPDGLGHINGRWFYIDPKWFDDASGGGFSPDTNRVPDASRITPMPVRPPTRAGHDISVTVTIDTGGPGLLDVASSLHEIDRVTLAQRDDNLPRKVMVALKDQAEIPNRDFVLAWKQTADTIEDATFAHMSERHADDVPGGGGGGGFFTLMLQPPARIDETETPIRGRELIFVMDTSGSMSGLPVEKSKAVITRAIDSMRPGDTFNIITFSGDTHILWDKPRPATAEHKAAAQQFVASRSGGGGTEMMKAIDAALVQQPAARAAAITLLELVDLPADGRDVEIALRELQSSIEINEDSAPAALPDPLFLERPDAETRPIRQWLRGFLMSAKIGPGFWDNTIRGTWETRSGDRVLVFRGWGTSSISGGGAMRIVMFLTDGYVGNDMEIIQAVRDNARTTRVFSFGIGNSVNRYLLDSMARAGRGEVEYVLLNANPDEAVERFTRRVQTPVLTDIELKFSDELQVAGLLTGEGIEMGDSGLIPDLYDVKPLIIHGRYATPGTGTLTVSGNSGGGRWSRTIDLELPAQRDSHDVIATLWARAKVENIMNRDLNAVQQGTPPDEMRREIVALGEQYQIMTQYTSFVAVEKSRMTIEGQPMLVNIPIELPDGTRWEGFFGDGPGAGECNFRDVAEDVVHLGLPLQVVPNENLRERIAGQIAESSQFSSVDLTIKESELSGTLEMRAVLEGAPVVPQGWSTNITEPTNGETALNNLVILGDLNQSLLRDNRRRMTLFSADDNGETLGREVRRAGRPSRALSVTAQGNVGFLDVEAAPSAAGQPSAGANLYSITASPQSVTLGETLRFDPTVTAGSVLRTRPDMEFFGGAAGGGGGFGGGAHGFAPIGEIGGSVGLVDELSIFEGAQVTNSSRSDLQSALEAQQSSSRQSSADSVERAEVTRRMIVESQLDRAHSLGTEGKSAEALQVVDEILALDEANPSAISLKMQLDAGSPPVVYDRTALLRRLFGTTEQPHFAERVAVLIAELVEHDEFETATTLLDALLAFDPSFEIGRQMCAVLDDDSLDAAAKKAAIAKLAEQARQRVIDSVEMELRNARIRDVVDPSLHMFAFGTGLPDTNDGLYDGPIPPAEMATVIGTGVRVTVLVRGINDDLLGTIRELGFKVEDTSREFKLIVGLAPFGRLDDLAVLAAVRRIEPTRVVIYETADQRR